MLWRRNAKDKSAPIYDALPPSGVEMKTTAYKEEEIESPRRAKPKQSWVWILFTQFLGALWLAPIVYLLYLNFSGYIIGPSVWCPRGNCPTDPLASDAVGKAQRFDKHDHNTLGALQFVAKALELWFIFVACALLYNIVMLLASHHGLPIGLLTSPVEFADPRSLIDTVRAANRSRHQRNATIATGAKLALALLIVFVAFMCLIVNLMGPAVAVLVIPTLQWINLPKNASHTLQAFHLDTVPANRSDGNWIFPNCDPEDVTDRLWSCTSDAYAASLDTWVDAAVAGDSQVVDLNNNTMYNGISPEGRLFFTFNVTNNFTQVAWVPNRQMLRELSSDLDLFEQAALAASASDKKHVEYDNIITNDRTEDLDETYFTNQTLISTATRDYAPYINSLQTILKRQGPIAGAFGNVYFPSNISETDLGTYKQARCFEGYTAYLPGLDAYNDDPTYTKCLKLGSDWDPTYKVANFSVFGDTSSATVYVYFSAEATYLAEGLDAHMLNACRANGTVTNESSCPWETIFDNQHLKGKNMSALTSNLVTVELSMPKDYPGQYIVLETVTYSYNATYTLDTSPVSNPNFLVQVDGVPDPATVGLQSVAVDPDWVLAAWSVDFDGGLYTNRSAANNLIRGLEAYFSQTSFSDQSEASNFTSSSTAEATATDFSRTAAASSEVRTRTRLPQSSPTSADNINKRQDAAATTTFANSASLVGAPTSYTAATTTMPVRPDDDEGEAYIDNYYGASDDTAMEKATTDLSNFIYFSFLQSLSMVSFDKANFTTPGKDPKDRAHPTLHYWAMVHVWAFGIDSRTSKFGVAVTVTGGLIVVGATVLGLLCRRRQRSLTELIVAAIEHQHQGELDHAMGDGEVAAKFRYKIQEDPNDGRVRFVPL